MTDIPSFADLLAGWRVMPVVVLDRAADAAPLADALAGGGIGCMEVTFRTSEAAEAIASVAGRDDVVVGAGTVTSATQAVVAIDAGSRFIVSPGFDDGVAAVCRELGVAYLPGVATATEIMRARAAGLDVLKLFPAEAIGGLSTLKALAAPFPDVRFVPTGGVDDARAAEYLAHPAVLAVGGSWMVPRDALNAGDWARIKELARGAAKFRES
jgi:2-dehydro-3-deoxyphosphogluconate aldolase/(4S)-4-hydroxy-2-oxoglutarate aldolase